MNGGSGAPVVGGGEEVVEELQGDVEKLRGRGNWGRGGSERCAPRRAESGGGWRSLAHVREPVWCTRGSIEGSQSFLGSQGNWLGGCRGAGLAEAACPR
jgi:hypothetical protein